MVSQHWDNILGSILEYSFFICLCINRTQSQIESKFHLLSYGLSSIGHHPWETILCSISVYSLFIWFLIMETLSQILSILNVCSFGFSSLGQYPMFYMSLFVFPSLGHHPRLYQSLNVSSFCFLSIGPHPRLNLSFFSLHVVSHHCDIILCSISIFCFFIWLLIIGTSSQVLSILNHLFLSIS